MSSLHWMPLYIPDYLADTTHLSAEEHGAYLMLIFHYWMQDGLPDDDDRLARIAHIPAERWPAVRSVLRPFFGDGWVHSRIEREREQAEATYVKRSEAGKKGGRPKGSKKPGIKQTESPAFPDGKPGSKPTESNHNHNHHISSHNQEEGTSKGKRIRERVDADGVVIEDWGGDE